MERPASSALLKLLLAGLAIGAVAAALVYAGNPGNMGLCIACFLRDIAGTAGGARLGMAGVAYLRPELLALVLGALAAAAASGEFRPRGGVAVVPRFVLGFVFMVSALVFLGCTVRAWLRVGGGDLNAVVGAAGLVAGIGAGSAFLRAGYALPKARDLSRPAGLAVATVAAVLLAIAVATGGSPSFLTVTPAAPAAGAPVPGAAVPVPPSAASAPAAAVAAPPSAAAAPAAAVPVPPSAASAPAAAVPSPAVPAPAPGAMAAPSTPPAPAAAAAAPRPVPPGGRRAPLAIALLAGLAVGVIAQRSRLCTTGGIRDLILWRRPEKLLGIVGLVAGALVVNAALGQFRLGFAGQPVAHTDAVANFAAMAVAGLAAVLMGGCPLRQVVMAGEGDADAGAALAGMVVGALVAHGTGLASSPRGPAPLALPALAVLAAVTVALAFRIRARAAAAAAPRA